MAKTELQKIQELLKYNKKNSRKYNTRCFTLTYDKNPKLFPGKISLNKFLSELTT